MHSERHPRDKGRQKGEKESGMLVSWLHGVWASGFCAVLVGNWADLNPKPGRSHLGEKGCLWVGQVCGYELKAGSLCQKQQERLHLGSRGSLRPSSGRTNRRTDQGKRSQSQRGAEHGRLILTTVDRAGCIAGAPTAP